MAEVEPFEGWAILELMGHRRLGGFVRQVELFGTAMCRIDVPAEAEGETVATQFYGGSSIYCMTPTTEEMARAVAVRNQPEPVQRWELPAPKVQLKPRHCVGCQLLFRPEVEDQTLCSRCEEKAELYESEHTVDQTPF